MAIVPRSMSTESADDIFSENAQMAVTQQETWEFAAVGVEADYAVGTPVGFNSSGYAGKWLAPDPASIEIDTGGASGGVFTMSVNGVSIGNVAFNITAALLKATIKSLTGHNATVALATGVYTITFDLDDDDINAVPTLTGTVSGLTGGTGEAATVTTGTATDGLHKIKGFVWPEAITALTTGSIYAVCAVYCKIDYDLIADQVASADVTALEAALKSEVLDRGIVVDNLGQVR